MHYLKGPGILLMNTFIDMKKKLEGTIDYSRVRSSNYLIAKHINMVLQQKSFKKLSIISRNIL